MNSSLRTYSLQENESHDDQNRVPVELRRSSIPRQPFSVVEYPGQHKYDRDQTERNGA